MKIKQFFGLLLIFMPRFITAQDCVFYYPEAEGAELVYQHTDKKGKPTSKTAQKIKVYKQTANGAEAKVSVKSYDEKGEFLHESELEVKCEDGVFYFDMSGYVNQDMIAAYESMEMKVYTDNLEMPSRLKIGDTLKDGLITIEIFSSGMKLMTLTVSITDRKVLAQENITNSAGTFKCYKLSQTILTRMGMKMEMQSTEWLSPGTGSIKSESYSSSGKFMGASELIEINR